MKGRFGLSRQRNLTRLREQTRAAFTLAGRHYFYHDERWGCDLDLLRTVPIPPKPRLLDLGCGIGLLSRVFALLFPDCRSITAVDYSKQLCEQAETELTGIRGVRVVNASIEEYMDQAKPASFDVVMLLNNTLGNCWAEDLNAHYTKLLSGTRRMLSTDGIALISVYARTDVTVGRYGNGLALTDDLGDGSFVGRVRRGSRSQSFFSHLFEPDEMERLMASAGFSRIQGCERLRRLVYLAA